MFTGIIEETGKLEGITPERDGLRLKISAGKVLEGTDIGDSIAVNGVCLTVVEMGTGSFRVQAVRETVSKTTIAGWRTGMDLNLERAVTANTRLGGHLVQGHIDGLGTIDSISDRSGEVQVKISAGREIMRYVVKKGSICVDGISLTVADAGDDNFELAIIPHTWKNTNLHNRRSGDKVNLETDIIARYIEKLMNFDRKQGGGLTEEFLRSAGF